MFFINILTYTHLNNYHFNDYKMYKFLLETHIYLPWTRIYLTLGLYIYYIYIYICISISIYINIYIYIYIFIVCIQTQFERKKILNSRSSLQCNE